MMLLVILALIVVCLLLAFQPRQQDERALRNIPLTATPEEWEELEEDGEVTILNDRDSRTPTIQYKRYRDE
ncbi:hypothetical protein KSD_23690 [Ktedonobacter sp. SOSP1-85]|uniref:hypothetical protein n=1 Tax=Ktedonobacter sp. SOSP1-85 TaxID=2778367 RepID=UPI00191648EC|nr:hypothetical protein [Ktedonobacter sp. SOSP1-85]GHO74598.1 hypothetical protein KSD_23690 [Ktedonobacter sp. SOSP1-85]